MSSVEKSASKWVFMLAVGLDDSLKADQDLYGAMKKEAIVVYDKSLKGRRQTLRPQFATAAEPWSYTHFTDSALSQATESICSGASRSTRPYYERGDMNSDNWVARWFLYHICRYRDNRNLRDRSSRFQDDNVDLPDPPAGKSGIYYDAARNKYR